MLFFAGPAQVGQSFTYRVTGTVSTQATPEVYTLVLSWTAPKRLYARLSGSDPTAAVSITRAGNGTLSVATPNANDAGTAAVAALLAQLNFPATLAARLNGADHTQTTFNFAPRAPVPASSSAPSAQPSPASVAVPLDVDLVNSGASATLIADGNSTNRDLPSDSGYGRRGGGMGGMGGGWTGGGGWRSRGADQSRNGSTGETPSAGLALEAVFDQSGSLQHATFRETFPSETKGAQPVEETFIIDRID
jgi:hypothetical protein